MRVNVQKLAELKISYSAFLAMPYGCAVSLGLFEEDGVHHALPPIRPRYRGFITDVSSKRNRSHIRNVP